MGDLPDWLEATRSQVTRAGQTRAYTPGPYRRGYRPGAELPPQRPPPMSPAQQDARSAVERMQPAQREFTGVSPLQDAGNQVFEMTGLPSMRRFGQEAAQGHIGRAAAEGGMGALALTGFAAGRPSVRSAPRPQRGIFGGRQTVANSGRSAPRASDGSTYPDRLWDKFNTAGVSRTRFGERDGANDVVDAYDAARLNQGVDQDSIFYADDAGGIHSRQPTPAERAQGRWSGNESAPPAGATNVRLPPPQLPPRPPQVDDAGGGGASQASTRPDGGAGGAGLDAGAMTALRNELREDGLSLPQSMPDLPRVSVPLSDLRRGQVGSLDRADARRYARQGPGAPPILVRRQGRNGWHIIDGNRRTMAAEMRGEGNIEAIDATGLFEQPPSVPPSPPGRRP